MGQLCEQRPHYAPRGGAPYYAHELARRLIRVALDGEWSDLLLQLCVVPSNPGTTGTDCVHAITTGCEAKTLRGSLGNLNRVSRKYHVLLPAQGLCGVGVVVVCSTRLLHVVQQVWNREHGPGEHTDNSGNHMAVQVDLKGERNRQGMTMEYKGGTSEGAGAT